jgi:hypothetical protein
MTTIAAVSHAAVLGRTLVSRVVLAVGTMMIACAAGNLRAEEVVWLEAEQFADLGTWTSDTQFIDQMGSPYLLANGLGSPVRDAATTVVVPHAGKYRLWARTKDWVPEHHPGRFQILVNDRPLEHVFGQSGKSGWQWEDGGVHELAGNVKLQLHDLTGYYGRCDVIVLTDRLDWIPPDEKEKLADLRQHYGGASRQVNDMQKADVVVVGGGLAGCLAAVSAARMGAQTVLIQDRPMLGGNASVEILVPPVGFWPYGDLDPLDPRETGLIEEVKGKGIQRIDEAKVYSGRLGRLVAAEPNLRLYLNTHVTGVQMQSAGTIEAVVGVDVKSGRRMRLPGRVFIDCTGDSIVGVSAGAEYRHGREARAVYGEPMAPEVADRKTMGNSLKYFSQPTGTPQPFESPSWAMEFPRCDSFTPGRHPRLGREIDWQWMIELGGTRDTYCDAEEIRDDLLRLMYGMWDHVKNHCDRCRQQAADHKLVWVGHVAGKRENRRLIGDYVLTQNDIANQVLFADRVAYGGWGMDDHFPEGFFYQGPPAQHGCKAVAHSIPLRCLYSKNIDNLMMAGRNVSASHIAMSATRVMLTCAVMGQAAGTAAAMCVDRDTTPRGIYEKYLEELQQQLLKDGAYLIDLPNRDPRDLARQATISASSQCRRASGEVMRAEQVIDGFARAAGGKTHAWGPEPGDREPWVQLSWDQPQKFNMVHLTFLTAAYAPRRFAIQAWGDSTWKTLAEVTQNRRRRHVIGLDQASTAKLRVMLLESVASETGTCEVRVYQEPERLVEIARRVAKNRDLPDAGPGLPWDESVTWFEGVDPRRLPGIVLDDTQAETVGDWVHSEYSQPFVANGYLHDGNTAKGIKSLRFALRVPEAGRYEIRLAYLAVANRSTNTPVTIETADGSQTVRVNQRVKPEIDGLFHSLGTFTLQPDKSALIVSNVGTDGYVVVDAVQLIPVER